MPSNADITALIEEAAAEGQFECPETDGLTNSQLAALLSETRKRAIAGTDDDDAVTGAGHTIASGKALTTKRGILADGATITAEDLPGGEETLIKLVESGHINAG